MVPGFAVVLEGGGGSAQGSLVPCHNSRPAGCATVVKTRKPNSCACAREAEAEFWQVVCNFEAGFPTSVGPCQEFCATRVVCNQTQRPPEKPWIAASHHSLTLPRNHTPLSPVAKSLGVCTQARIVVDDRTTRRNSLLNSVSVISVIIHSKKNKLNQSGR